jgi:hypothetical protein
MTPEQIMILLENLIQNIATTRELILVDEDYQDEADDGELIIQELAQEFNIRVPSLRALRDHVRS